MKPTFKEEQTFMQSWIGWAMMALFIFPLYAIYQEYMNGLAPNVAPESNLWLIITAIFTVMVMIFLLLIKLKTEINQHEILMKFFPLTSKTVQWNEVKSAEVVNYGFVGGWGIRLWTKFGTVYNISGNTGLAIELNNGKKFLIGTHMEKELKSFMESLKSKQRL